MSYPASAQAFTLDARASVTSLWWKLGRIEVKATGEQTGGRYAAIEVTDPQGTSTPMHRHDDADEAFFVLDGTVRFFADGEAQDITAGGFAFVPKGVEHSYLVVSEQARMHITYTPAGFEQAFLDIGMPVAEHPEPPEDSVYPPPAEMTEAFAAYACIVTGPPPTLEQR